MASTEAAPGDGPRRKPTFSAGVVARALGARVGRAWEGQQRLANAEHTSLEQRFGALQVVRLCTVGLVVAAAIFVPEQLGLTVKQVMPLSFAYLALCLFGQLADHIFVKHPKRSRAPLQQMLLPVDSLYLAILTVPSGGAQSDFILLFAVQLIAVTLLCSPRTGVRLALWDSVLLISISVLGLADTVGQFLGASRVLAPAPGAVELRIVGLWAVAVSTAYFSALSERELRRSKAQLDALTRMASEMERSMEANSGPDEIAAVLLKTVLQPFLFKQAGIVWEIKGRSVAARVAAPDLAVSAVPLGELENAALGDGVAARALVDNTPVLVRKLSHEHDGILQLMVPDATNVVVVPLRAGRERLGVLVAEAGPPLSRRVSRRSLDMLNRFAAHAALALNNADLKSEVARLAASDSLTGLANRRELSAVLMRVAARAARNNEPLSLAVIDIDHFKAINDTFGHLMGDEVLRQVAEAMARSVRDGDLVARYGGEEFAIVLPDCASEGALAVVERVRAAVESAATLTKVTVSAGIATSLGERSAGESLMAAADEALYVSKRAGRDRVTLASLGAPFTATVDPAASAITL